MPDRVRRYRNSFSDMLHELKLMRDRDEIKVPENMSDSEYEEIMKKIDKHFADGGVTIHHPEIRGRITDTSSIEHLNKFFQHVYASSNTMNNVRARARNTQNRRTQATVNRFAAAAAARNARMRASVPRNAAAAARVRTATRNAGRASARVAATVARMRTARLERPRSRSQSRSRRSRSGVRV